MKKKTLLIGLVAAVILCSVWSERARSIPAFARRYKISCNTCHNPFPRLKDYGDEFAGDGFVIPEEERERDYVSAGDDLLWLNRGFPVAVKFEAFSLVDPGGDITNDIEAPWGVKLLSGGPLFKNVSYYFYMYLSERGEVAGLEDAYIHFNDILGTGLDIMAGQFQTSDPLMKRELRLTFEDYQVYRGKIGKSSTNLAYDRGLMFLYGIEKTGTDLIAMVVNGNGIPEADEDTRIFDSDSYKNAGFRITQGLGDHLSLGGFYYLGKEKNTNTPGYGYENEMTYYGPDIALGVDRFSLSAQYLLREDTNPVFINSPGEKTRTGGVVAELIFAPYYDRSRTYLTLLYNYMDSDLDAHDYHSVALSGTYLLARNLRLLGEYIRYVDDEEDRIVVGVISGF